MKKLLTTVIVLGAVILQANAEVKIKIRSIAVDDNVYTPYYGIETEQTHDQGSAQRWVRLEVKYSTSGGWIDELAIKQLAIANEHGDKSPVILEANVTYLNVGPGNHVAYVYMHPNCVKRYDVKAKALNSAAIFSINGKVVAQEETARKTKAGWSTSGKYTIHEGHLLSEADTPFWFVNYDFKEMIQRTPHKATSHK